MERSRSRDRDDDRGSRSRGRDEGRDDDRGRSSRGRDEGRDDDRGRSSRGRDDDRGGRGGRSSGRGFEYKARDSSAVKHRGEQGGNDYDRIIKDSLPMYKPADGSNTIRIMPPTWPNADHFGLDVYVHYEVGPDNQSYLCLDKMKGEACPICEERARATKDNDTEYADKLKPAKRVLVYLIDRDNQRDGPKIWSMPWTIDRDLCKLVVHRRSGEVLPIDDPEKGYDIEFDRQGKGTRTQYVGLAVARRESDIGKPEWMDFVVDNPIPDQLQFYDYDHIAKQFGGQGSTRDDDRKGSRRDLDREQEEGLRKAERSGRASNDAPTWESVHSMTYEELCALIDDERLSINPKESEDDEQLATWICEDLKIDKPSARESAETTTRSKLDETRGRRQRID